MLPGILDFEHIKYFVESDPKSKPYKLLVSNRMMREKGWLLFYQM